MVKSFHHLLEMVVFALECHNLLWDEGRWSYASIKSGVLKQRIYGWVTLDDFLERLYFTLAFKIKNIMEAALTADVLLRYC